MKFVGTEGYVLAHKIAGSEEYGSPVMVYVEGVEMRPAVHGGKKCDGIACGPMEIFFAVIGGAEGDRGFPYEGGLADGCVGDVDAPGGGFVDKYEIGGAARTR